MLPNDMRNLHAIELGCGTGHVSGWMARRDATVTGINNFDAQLTVARHLMRENNTDLELLHGNAETVPKPDTSYDFSISEYGAAIWCDPMVWLPEAARLLKPGGKLRLMGIIPWPLHAGVMAGQIPTRYYADATLISTSLIGGMQRLIPAVLNST